MAKTPLETAVRDHFYLLAESTEEAFGAPVLRTIVEYLSYFLDDEIVGIHLFSRVEPSTHRSGSVFGFNSEIVFFLTVDIEIEHEERKYEFAGYVVPVSAVKAIRFLEPSGASTFPGNAPFATPALEIVIDGEEPVRIGGSEGLKSLRPSWDAEPESTPKDLFTLVRRSSGAAR